MVVFEELLQEQSKSKRITRQNKMLLTVVGELRIQKNLFFNSSTSAEWLQICTTQLGMNPVARLTRKTICMVYLLPESDKLANS